MHGEKQRSIQSQQRWKGRRSMPGGSQSETPVQPAPPTRHLRVLLLDDDVAVRTAVGSLLEECGLCVSQAGSGLEALEKLADASVDVVLLDMSISDAPARTFIPRIKRSSPDARILLFSGREVEVEVARLADGVVRKPAFVDELCAAIQRVAGS
jgi:CheY-like chemotaxis protein